MSIICFFIDFSYTDSSRNTDHVVQELRYFYAVFPYI